MFNYNIVDPKTVKDAKFISYTSSEYQNFLEDVHNSSKKTKGEREREEIIRNNPEKIKEIENFVKLALENPERAKSKIINEIGRDSLTCGNCVFSRNDKYREGKENLVCWRIVNSRKPAKIKASDDALNCDEFIYEKNKDLHRFIEAIDGDYEKIRKYALKLATRVWSPDTEYAVNKPRMEAILRDIDSEVAKTSEMNTKDAHKFENKVRDKLREMDGVFLKDRVLRLEQSNGIQYKELDYRVKIEKYDNVVIEAYTCRGRPEKKNQLNNYLKLSKIALGHRPKGLLLQGPLRKDLTKNKLIETINEGFLPKLRLW